jgi:hypothetical protein
MTLLAGLRRSFPTFFLMARPFEWIGRSRRRTCVAALVALAMVAGPPVWWATQFWGLPDVGDPFDVAAFRALAIPVDRNAYLDYQEAWALFKPGEPYRKTAGNAFDVRARWSHAVPEVRRWAEENRAALAVYRRGTERPDALGPVPEFQGTHQESWGMHAPLQFFEMLAILEGSRLEEQGDMEGAWGWYRAVLRTIGHVGMHGTVYRRSIAQQWHNELRDRLTVWAADPRTTPTLLRNALDDVDACESLAPSEPYTLKAEYLDVDRLLEMPEISELSLGSWASAIAPTDILPREQVMRICDVWRSWLGEPERSRRVMRLAIANWLAYHDLPPADRPPADPKTAGPADFFYPLGPNAPANVRAVSPRALAGWLRSTFDANVLFGSWGWKAVRGAERSNHRALLILLGQELYRRDHGDLPPTPESLVGPYLKSLPALPDDERDETIPMAGKTVDRE